MRNDQSGLIKELLRYKNNYERDEELLEKIERVAFDNISADEAIEIIRALFDESGVER